MCAESGPTGTGSAGTGPNYGELMEQVVEPAARKGLSATVYTQLSDVEEEINGLLTYDREVLKMDGEMLRERNRKLRNAVDKGGG